MSRVANTFTGSKTIKKHRTQLSITLNVEVITTNIALHGGNLNAFTCWQYSKCQLAQRCRSIVTVTAIIIIARPHHMHSSA